MVIALDILLIIFKKRAKPIRWGDPLSLWERGDHKSRFRSGSEEVCIPKKHTFPKFSIHSVLKTRAGVIPADRHPPADIF
jgi:hypothetical protein